MNNRLLEIIKYKTGGKQTEFANLLGWSPQYLAKLLKGDNFGIRPVIALLETFPEINARWLMLGDGDMIADTEQMTLRKNMLGNINKVLELEKYIPVMSSTELRYFENISLNRDRIECSEETIAKWEELLKEREVKINDKFRPAIIKSVRECKHPKAKK